jgi:cystathionine gamma-synthase/methionine-gamma-lyase
MGGIAVSRDEMDTMALTGVMKLVGGVLSPWEAHEILRGVKTLGVRMERHCQNAKELAAHLKNDTRVTRVYFPGLASGDEGSVAGRMLRAGQFGALVSLELKENTRDAAFRFMDALKLCIRSTSLGDVFSSALHPATASHRDLSPARRRELGISDGLIRISVGIENVQDIIADIDQALNSVAANVDEPEVAATGSIR